jgi:hypothetical protein
VDLKIYTNSLCFPLILSLVYYYSLHYYQSISLNTTQFCNLIGDQPYVFMNSNFKILFNQTKKDKLSNWILNGEAQNIGPNPLNNI